MGRTEQPEFRALDRAEAEAVLARNHVGRLAYSSHDQVDMEPVHYVFADEWLWGRTGEGAKWRVLGENAYQWWPVAFEVDEVEGLFRWRSVVVKGGFQVVAPPEADGDPAVWEEALAHLRTLVPETLTEADPVPERDHLFRIAVQEITGREALPQDGAGVDTLPEGRAGGSPDARRPQ